MYWIFIKYVNEAEADDFEEVITHAGKVNSLISIFIDSVHEDENFNSWFPSESPFQQKTLLSIMIQLYKTPG